MAQGPADTPLAVNVNGWRISEGLDQAEAAERCEVSVHTISDWETGRVKRPKVKTLHRAARAMGKDPRELLRYPDDGTLPAEAEKAMRRQIEELRERVERGREGPPPKS